MGTLRILFATILFTINLVVSTVLIASLGLLTGWIGPRGNVIFWWCRVWSRCWLAASGTPARAVFHPAVDRAPETGVIYLANHVSWFDIPAVVVTAPGQVRFAAKRGLFHIPLFGWALHLGGFIPVDRGDRQKAADVYKKAAERLGQGQCVVLFPEGTRARNGRLGAFHRGGVVMAQRSGCPIVPVGIRGTYRAMPPGHWRVRPGPLEVHFGAPVDAATLAGKDRKTALEELRQSIAELAGLDGEQYPEEG